MHERDTEGFQVVKRKGQRKRSYLIIRKEEEEEESQELGEQLRQRLLDIQVEISSETFYSDLLDVLGKSPVNRLVCLGLGHFSTCPIARVQLAFIVSLTKLLDIPEVLLQDPVFTLPEIKFLESLHFNVPSDNLEGRFQTEDNQRVVYYLPHCPKSLTNNLLATNWNPQKLSNSVLICNSFQGLLLNTLDRDIVKEAGYVKRISKYTTESPLKVSERHFDSFNDTSIHFFEKERLGEINDTDFWTVSPTDPTTTDLELISRDLPEKLTI